MIRKIIMMLIALNMCVASGKCQRSKSHHCADSSAITFIPMEKLSKSFAKAKEAESSDIVDVKFEWTKDWGYKEIFDGQAKAWGFKYTCEKQLIHADGNKETYGNAVVIEAVSALGDPYAGFESESNKKIIVSSEYNFIKDSIMTEAHSIDDVVFDGDALLETWMMGSFIDGGDVHPSSNFDKFGDGGGSSPRDINYLLTKTTDENFYGVIRFTDWYHRRISFGVVGSIYLILQIPDCCLITSPLSEGGLILFPTSSCPTSDFNYTYNEVQGDPQYLKTYKGYASLTVSQYGMDFKSSCDFTFHITKPTTPENIQRAKDLGLM